MKDNSECRVKFENQRDRKKKILFKMLECMYKKDTVNTKEMKLYVKENLGEVMTSSSSSQYLGTLRNYGADIERIDRNGKASSLSRYRWLNKESRETIECTIEDRAMYKDSTASVTSNKDKIEYFKKNKLEVTKENVKNCMKLVLWEMFEDRVNLKKIEKMLIIENVDQAWRLRDYYYENKEDYMLCRF